MHKVIKESWKSEMKTWLFCILMMCIVLLFAYLKNYIPESCIERAVERVMEHKSQNFIDDTLGQELIRRHNK